MTMEANFAKDGNQSRCFRENLGWAARNILLYGDAERDLLLDLESLVCVVVECISS